MQESPVLPNWIQTAFGWLASAIAGGAIVRLWTTWLNRKKPAAEVHLTDATANEIHVRAGSGAGDAIIRMMLHLERAQLTIDRLRTERDGWQDEYDKTFTELVDSRAANRLLQSEVANYENEIKTMKATLTLNGKNYDNTQDKKLNKP